MEKKTQERPDWIKILDSILDEPGKLGDYYHAFHRFSLGNQALAMGQMADRAIDISPIASFAAWKLKGRKVMKGQKAIALWMPITVKSKDKDSAGAESADGGAKRIFVMRNNWFAHSQTEVDPTSESTEAPTPEVVIEWKKELALDVLGIEQERYDSVDGNCQGYAYPTRKIVAINPLAALPHKTLFHEMAHCILHGAEEVQMVDGSNLSTCIKEAEAESTAFLCCAALGLPGLMEARGYVQAWLGGRGGSRDAFKKSAARIFSTADKILKAGLPKVEKPAVTA